MSFFTYVVTILRTVNMQFEDEEAVRKAFLERFGANGGWEDETDVPNAKLQLENVARTLDCKVRVSAEVSQSTPLSPSTISSRLSDSSGVINPLGTQQGWARWKSSAHDAIEASPRYTFGSVSQPPIIISVGVEILNELGWPTLLKELIRCKGDLGEALLNMRGNLETSGSSPANLDKSARLEQIMLELEEKAKTLNAMRMSSASPQDPVSNNNSNNSFSSPVARPSVPSSGFSPTIEQSLLERFMAASANNNVHSMVNVGSLPTLKGSSLSAIETFSNEYFTSIASKTFNSANKSLHPIRGLTSDNYKVMSLIWNGTQATRALGPFASSDAVEPAIWLRALQEAIRVSQRAPKVGEKLELEKTSNGSPKIDEYIVKLQRHFEHHSQLTLEKKLELATKGLKKHFKNLGTFVEDTAIPDEKYRCERENETFTIELALFIILKEFRSYMGARQNSQSSGESSDDNNDKRPTKFLKKRKSRNERDPGSSRNDRDSSSRNDRDSSSRNDRDSAWKGNKNNNNKPVDKRDKAYPKQQNLKNNGGELGKMTCHICKAEDHLMSDCPQYDPNYKKKKGRFNMIRSQTKLSLFCGHFKVGDSEELVVQYDTGAEDGNYCSEEFARLAEAQGTTRQPSSQSVKLADGKTGIDLTHDIEVTVTLCFKGIGREDKSLTIRCAILPGLPYMLTLGALDISAHDLLPDLAVLTAFKKQGHWNAIKGSDSIASASKVSSAKVSTPTQIPSTTNNSKDRDERITQQPSRLSVPIPILSSTKGDNAGSEGGKSTTPTARATTTAKEEVPPRVLMERKEEGFHLVNPPSIDEDDFDVQEVLSDTCSDTEFGKIQWGDINAEFQKRIVNVLKRYEGVFSEQVSPIPCDLEPYKITLKKGIVFPPKAMLQNVRQQTAANEAFLSEKLKKWEDLGIIKKVSSRYWSQVHIALKEGKSPRLCIDWRALNANAELFQFPIPDIKKTLSKLKNHKFYATIDLTDAYTQILMDESSVEYTAFRTQDSIYVMTRLGFGHSGAVPHFQKEIATKVLEGLIGHLCYNYLDDIALWGDEEESFLASLVEILGRLQRYKIKAKMSKLKFGTSITFLGHLIDKMGMAMSDDRKAALTKIQLPSTVRELHVFLGTANFFRDFVKNQSFYTTLLTRKLTTNLREKLTWTEEEKGSFEGLKEAILKAPILWWIQENLVTGISTDASVYSWGSYLWQLDEQGKERIILFISGTFSGASLIWPINEKEMYAIVATFAKIKYLIGTINVNIKTDHANLTYMSQPSKSEKVERWKLNLSRYAHTFQVVAGADNVVADGMSRLMGISIIKSSNLMSGRNAQAAILRDFHGGIAGHRGVEVTLQRLISCGHQWDGMEAELKALVSSCPVCQVVKPNTKRGFAQTFELSASEEMETIAMDTLGPLDQDSKGHAYILALTDEFSRYTELTATTSTSAAEAAKTMLNYCCTYGVPKRWKSDRGSQFNNSLIQTLSKSLMTIQTLTSVGSSEENGIVERKFRDVRADLGALVREDPTSDWSDKIKIVQRIINSTPSSATSIAPADLRFGKVQSLDVNLLIKAPSETKPDGSVPELQTAQVTRLRATYDKLASTIESHLDKHGAVKAKKRRSDPTQYPVGSWVFWELADTRKGDPKSTRRTGPYQVISQVGNAVKVLCNEKEKVIPVSACTAFVPGQVAPERLQAENSESAETRYFVSEILDHCFDVPTAPKLGNCKLLVKWVGYPEQWHYILDVPDLRMTEALVRYVKSHTDLAWLLSKKVRPS